MNVNSDVEVVMECKVRAKSVSAWIPSATSTPVRKALSTLSNSEFIYQGREVSLISRKASDEVYVTNKTHEGKKLRDGNKRSIQRRDTRKIFDASHSSDDDRDYYNNDYEKPDNKTKKPLVIHLGSNKNDRDGISKRSKLKPLNKNNSSDDLQSTIDNKTDKIKDVKQKCLKNEGNPELHSIVNSECASISLCKGKVADVKLENIDSKYVKEELGCIPLNISNSHDGRVSLNLPNNQLSVSDDNMRIITLRKRRQTASSKGITSKKQKNKLKSEHVKFNVDSSSKGNETSKIIKKLESNSYSMKNINNVNNLSSNKCPTKPTISHEIFSDSKEKAQRDSLDLTAIGDVEEITDNNHISLSSLVKCNKKSNYSLKSDQKPKLKIDSKSGIKFNDEFSSGVHPVKILRSSRKRSLPKKFWLPKAEENKHLSNLPSDANEGKLIEKKKNSSSTVACSSESGNFESDIFKSPKKDSNTNFVSNDLFKNVSKMDFAPNLSGDRKSDFLTAVGWCFPSFKCCILKIKRKSEASGRTKSTKSHFGGILLNGRLLMKIEGVETVMKSGEMFYVPPLSDWKAVNKGTTECVLYYWCGRF